MAPSQLEIKVRSLQRLVKEEKYYQQELEDQKTHVQKLKSEGQVDPYDLKKQVEVLQDTERLLPALYGKIDQFKHDLALFVDSYNGSEDLDSAKSIIEDAENLLKSKS
ncbi:LANO_0H16666g1_1 [Lachancea nothofagi CBS 11611]|uniref:Tubulin-specific chaperone A n=1 Tax=Lachancea nothofagi CBS 11611 TaxID=1266666 RepID=A0A1G4KMT5_9SACH|nr:LANO_0H16666g1_1 [Lachancea nothofagi CBS 11611]